MNFFSLMLCRIFLTPRELFYWENKKYLLNDKFEINMKSEKVIDVEIEFCMNESCHVDH